MFLIEVVRDRYVFVLIWLGIIVWVVCECSVGMFLIWIMLVLVFWILVFILFKKVVKLMILGFLVVFLIVVVLWVLMVVKIMLIVVLMEIMFKKMCVLWRFFVFVEIKIELFFLMMLVLSVLKFLICWLIGCGLILLLLGKVIVVWLKWLSKVFIK